MRVTSNSWDSKRVFARERHPDEWARPVEPYDPCEAGEEIIEDVTVHGEDTTVFTELVTGKGDAVTDE